MCAGGSGGSGGADIIIYGVFKVKRKAFCSSNSTQPACAVQEISMVVCKVLFSLIPVAF